MPTQHDVVMVGTVLSQKDRGLAPPAAVGVLVQLVESVREPWAAEQHAASIALGDVSSVTCVRIRHARAGAATFGICREQGCVFAVEVVDLLLQLDKLVLMFVSCQLGMLGSVEGVDFGQQIHAFAHSIGCEQCSVLSLKLCYVLLQLAVCLPVGMCLVSCLSELCACG